MDTTRNEYSRNLAFLPLAAAMVFGIGVAAPPALAETHEVLAGDWIAEGQDPDGTVYNGAVSLTVNGDSLIYDAEMHGDTYAGVGLWNPDAETLAVDFVEGSSGSRGLSMFVLQNGVLKGRWLYSDAPGEIGEETWRRPNG